MVEAVGPLPNDPPSESSEDERGAEADLDELAGRLGLGGDEGRLWLRLARRFARGSAQVGDGKKTSEFKLTVLAVLIGGALMALGATGVTESELAGRLVDDGSKIALYPLIVYVGGRKGLKAVQEWVAGRTSS